MKFLLFNAAFDCKHSGVALAETPEIFSIWENLFVMKQNHLIEYKMYTGIKLTFPLAYNTHAFLQMYSM